MLYKFPKLITHQSYRLNRNLVYFFSKLRGVNQHSTLNPLSNYFDAEFSHFLGLNKQQTLRTHFTTFFDEFKILDPNEKNLVIQIFTDSQKIGNILTNTHFNGNSIKTDSLPASIRDATRALFNYLFSNTLNSFGKLKDHYKTVFNSLQSNICPFCGIEFLNDPSIIRQDYDHMLMISSYALSGVNMDNLIPTGVECNRINKHNVDVLYNGAVRTVFNSAYTQSFDIRISLHGSTPPSRPTDIGNWHITITPTNSFTSEWERVYNIKNRYTNNVLKKFYSGWLKELREYLFISDRLPINEQNLLNELTASSLVMKENPTLSLSNIVKGAVYEFLANNNDPAYRTAVLSYINSRT
ncbi:MAG: hypothetical protein JNL69_05460 [Bacteroidia bacterium]|nr:hypothetical protein [Bacteroidia bacterium]